MARVLITGGAGFIAHHMVHHLLKHTDHEIVTLDRLDYSGNLNRLNDVLKDMSDSDKKRVDVVFHDLKAAINPCVSNAIGKVDVILHLAAGSHVDRSIDFPMEFVLDNVVGTANILDYARTQDNLERFVYFSTDEVFGPAPNGIKYKENDRYNSTNPYSATKAGGEELAVAYQNTYSLPVMISHTMNVFGERQHPEKYIPICIRRAKSGERIYIHADPTKKVPGSRHYVHADDVASAVLFLMNQPYKAEPDATGAKCPKFNIVGSEELNNLQVGQIVAEAQGKQLNYELVDFHSSRPGHDLRYALDGSKMREMGWEPAKSVKERIQEVTKWTLKNNRWL